MREDKESITTTQESTESDTFSEGLDADQLAMIGITKKGAWYYIDGIEKGMKLKKALEIAGEQK